MTSVAFDKAADAFLMAMDDAPLGTIFKDQTTKDWMETSVHRALTKLQAAAYHCLNVDRLLKNAHAMATARTRSGNSPGVPKPGTTRTSGTFPVSEVAYEIDAFLASARASVDFSANIIALHLGMNRRTGVTTVLDCLEKTPNSPFTFVLRERAWITVLKTYRDECVHFRTLRARIGYEAVRSMDVAAETTIPFVVSEGISPYDDQPDTRARRAFQFAMGEDFFPAGLSRTESRGSSTAQDGTEILFQHSIRYETVPGYLPADEFCRHHLDRLRKFTAYLLKQVPKVGFVLQRRPVRSQPRSRP